MGSDSPCFDVAGVGDTGDAEDCFSADLKGCWGGARVFAAGSGGGPSPPYPRAFSTLGLLNRLNSEPLDFLGCTDGCETFIAGTGGTGRLASLEVIRGGPRVSLRELLFELRFCLAVEDSSRSFEDGSGAGGRPVFEALATLPRFSAALEALSRDIIVPHVRPEDTLAAHQLYRCSDTCL